MKHNQPTTSRAWSALRKMAHRPPPVERCEMCNIVIPGEHPHLLDLQSRDVVCACRPCALLFSPQQHPQFRCIPDDPQLLANFSVTDAQWESLMIPIAIAFITKVSTTGQVVALYPGPAGPIESQLTLETWEELQQVNPVLGEMQPDVEALLINRLGKARDYYRLGVDECYKLVGILRANWHGLSGGTEVWQKVAKFFTTLKERAIVIEEPSNA